MRGCLPNFGSWGNHHDDHSYTFNNTAAGEKAILTVTGDVLIRLIPVCTTSLASAAAASLSLGVVGDNDHLIPDTLATDLDARMIWHDSTPDSEIELLSAALEFIVTDGNNVVIDLTDQIDSGVIKFYYIWMPLSADGNVTKA